MLDSYRFYGDRGKGYKYIKTTIVYSEQMAKDLLDTNYKVLVIKRDELNNMDIPFKVMLGDYGKVRRRIK